MQIIRAGIKPSIHDIYTFRVDVSADSETIHIYLDSFFRTEDGKLLENAPRWRRNDERFSTIDYVDIPQNITDEVLERLKSNFTFHYPSGDKNDS